MKWIRRALNKVYVSTGPIFRSATPELITQEHAAWICGTELIRALARAAARQAAPARKGRLAGRKALGGDMRSRSRSGMLWRAAIVALSLAAMPAAGAAGQGPAGSHSTPH